MIIACETVEMYRRKYTVKQMCRVLKVSESGYYRWLRNHGKQTGRQLLLVKIKEIVKEHPDNHNYGVDRILLALLQKGIQVSRRTVYRAMQEGGMLHKKAHASRHYQGINRGSRAGKPHQTGFSCGQTSAKDAYGHF